MKKIIVTVILLILFTPLKAFSEVAHISMDEAVSLALENNP